MLVSCIPMPRSNARAYVTDVCPPISTVIIPPTAAATRALYATTSLKVSYFFCEPSKSHLKPSRRASGSSLGISNALTTAEKDLSTQLSSGLPTYASASRFSRRASRWTWPALSPSSMSSSAFRQKEYIAKAGSRTHSGSSQDARKKLFDPLRMISLHSATSSSQYSSNSLTSPILRSISPLSSAIPSCLTALRTPAPTMAWRRREIKRDMLRRIAFCVCSR
mmetsp:Transcript_11894/g.27668  ORF Transcript_11894/g.27668 Transcript_11894/m.27668 type:complete len:222 (-) Transcript_11894:189-854(-)